MSYCCAAKRSSRFSVLTGTIEREVTGVALVLVDVSQHLMKDLRGTAPGSRVQAAARVAPGQPCHGCRSGAAVFPFTMAFQPIVDVVAGRIDAYEALVRGPAGEGADHILGQVDADNVYAFDQACRVKAIEMAAGLGMSRQLNINFLPNAVYEPRACIRATLEAASRTGFDPGRLTFEIVETELITDPVHLLNIAAEYRRQGFKIALDDFGTGYSDLGRLVTLQPDIVKLDRTLVQGCDTDSRRLDVLGSMLGLGDKLGIKVVLEGVETAAEVAALRGLGARFIQGFFFARPSLAGLIEDTAIFPQG